MASDACRCLGLGMERGTHLHLRKLAEDEKQVVRKKGSMVGLGALFSGSDSMHTLVNESGLYKLIMRPDKPEARQFQDWVTREVLPAIRKTGGYLLNEDMRAKAAADSREEFPLPTSFSDALRKLADEVERREDVCPVRTNCPSARKRTFERPNLYKYSLPPTYRHRFADQ